MQIKVEKDVGGIRGLCVITPAVHGDRRGYFMETYSLRDMEEAGLKITFVQDNQSQSSYGVVRGIHFQKGEFSQAKLVRVLEGKVLDVAVDLRRSSPTFGQHVARSDVAEFCYKCDDFYHPGDEGGLAWNDPAIGIDWGVSGVYRGTASAQGYTMPDGTPLLLSEKDEKWQGLAQE